MQQRQLRLGDILDDYCPRERRVTNHAIVALVGDEIRLTRCTTCESEHEYKQARVPPQRRKKEAPGVLYQQVLSGLPRKAEAAALLTDEPGEPAPEAAEPSLAAGEASAAASEPTAGEPEDGPVHRRLIRATLPRIEGQEPVRREPDFTFRGQPPGRGNRFSLAGRGGHRPAGPHANGHRSGSNRHGQPGGQRQSGRPAHPGHGNRQRQGGGGKKRSR